MLNFIIEYWVQFLLGTIVTALTFVCKKFYSLYMGEKQHQKTKEHLELYESLKKLIEEGAEESRRLIRESAEESREGDRKLQEQINLVQGGILSIQSRSFKQECRELLREDRDITLEEFESLQEEYEIYKNLGGNHDGDLLFSMIREKVTNILTDVK